MSKPYVEKFKNYDEDSTEASYGVSCCTALAEAHTFAETPIKPCAMEMTTCALGEHSKKKVETVQLSTHTVKVALKIRQQI